VTDGESLIEPTKSLAELLVNEAAEIVHLETENVTKSFLSSEGVVPGEKVKILAIGSKGLILLTVGENQISISKDVAEKIIVRLIGEHSNNTE
jgi:Fe2+ transport system protein FeoA